jgi:sigma-B regulation protein RsbU (phosphoserine phosphatase)
MSVPTRPDEHKSTPFDLLHPTGLQRLIDSFRPVMADAEIAVLDPGGRLIVGAGDWDERTRQTIAQAAHSGQWATHDHGSTPVEAGTYRMYRLSAHGQWSGILAVHGKATGPVEQALFQSVNLAFEQAALAGEGLGEKRALQLQALMEITRELTATLDLEKLLDMIMGSAVELLHSMAGSLFLIDEESGDLVFRVVTSGDEHLIGTHVPQGQGIIGQAAESGNPVVVHDVRGTKDFYQKHDHVGFESKSLLAVPLKVPDRTIGVVELINKVDGSEFTEQDTELLLTFAAQAAIAVENARLVEAALVKERLENEARLAFEVQASLIPASTPDVEGWDFAAWWLPARECSGDFYDFLTYGGELSVVLGDVSDKGMHAALFMALTRSIIRASAGGNLTPAESLSRANRLICADATGGMFVTLFFADISRTSGEVTYVNCGHNPPLVARKGDDAIEPLSRTGMVLGLDRGFQYEQRTINLNSGDLMVMYTDGVTEAFSEEGKEFGDERLRALIDLHRNDSAAEVMQALQNALEVHVGEGVRSDDITVVIARRL